MDEHDPEVRERSRATRRVGHTRALVVAGALATSLAVSGTIAAVHATSADNSASTPSTSSPSTSDNSSLVTPGSSHSSSQATTGGS